MSRTTNSFTPTLHQYYSAHAYREAPVLAELRTETARAGAPDGREVHSRNWYVYRLLVAAMALGSGAQITAVDEETETEGPHHSLVGKQIPQGVMIYRIFG